MGLLKIVAIAGVLCAVGMYYLTLPREVRPGVYMPSRLCGAAIKTTTEFVNKGKDKPRGSAGKLLVLATQDADMKTVEGKFFDTGNHPVETLVPLLHVVKAGYQVVVATPTGEPVVFEKWALPTDDAPAMNLLQELRPKFQQPLSFEKVTSLEEYDGVFLPGGHGAMMVMDHDTKDLSRILNYFLSSNKVVAAICHGPAILLAGDEKLLKTREVVAFPDWFDKNVAPRIGYLPGQMSWFVQDLLSSKKGMNVLNNDAKFPDGRVHRDGMLLSGDSPDAADKLGQLFANVLAEKQ